jgi:nicotinate-nucleotide pyrophosphorylase (carboxylating)
MSDRSMPLPVPPDVDASVALALAEDFGLNAPGSGGTDLRGAALLARDVTTSATIPPGARLSATVTARQDLVVAGLPYAQRAWTALAELAQTGPVTFRALVAEGARASAGTALARLEGPAAVVLGAERTALDFLMVLSGIATESARWQDAADAACRETGRPSRLVVTDTRKTVPGLRAASKYAVAVGGATNHRAGLWDMVLVKDNHLRLAGGVTAALDAARSGHPGIPVEIEADSLAQAEEAARAGADIVLLDNMDDAGLAEAVLVVRAAASEAGHRCLTEASGGVTFERLAALAATGVDRVSTSKLTLAPPVDVALDLADADSEA